MRGRIFGIKKTYILWATAVIALIGFLTYLFLSIFMFKRPELWFYAFFVSIGSYEIVKSLLFKLDSSFYLGTLTTSIGGLGFVYSYTNTVSFAIFYIALAFVVASILTAIYCGQRFHLIYAFSIIFVSTYGFLFAKNMISLAIFIAFDSTFLILFIVTAIIAIKRRR